MKKIKKYLERMFIDGLSGMALGLFSTLIIGTILGRVGLLIGGEIGGTISIIGGIATVATGGGIGAGVAKKLEVPALVSLSAIVAGLVGAHAKGILLGDILVSGGQVSLSGGGEPLGAFLASYVGIEVGRFLFGKTKVDILVVPLGTILSGSISGLAVGIPISSFMRLLGEVVNWGTMKQPFWMGIIVAVIMGIVLTLPISSAALGIILNLSGAAAGAATIGCCCHMVGFAVMSFRENGIQGLIAQGLGTSMLQVPNLIRKPILWIPPVLASAILGPIGIMGFGMTNEALGSGMGTSGLVGQITTYQTMIAFSSPISILLKIVFLQILIPAFVCWGISKWMRKRNYIKSGDLKLEL